MASVHSSPQTIFHEQGLGTKTLLFLSLYEQAQVAATSRAWNTSRQSSFGIVPIFGETPYERGLCHGTLLRREIGALAELIPPSSPSIPFGYIPEEWMQEMEGISKGSGVPLETIITANTVHRHYDNHLGCRIVAKAKEIKGALRCVVATNHYDSTHFFSPDPNSRVDSSALYYKTFSGAGIKEILFRAANKLTCQAMIFDPCAKTLQLSSITKVPRKPFNLQTLFSNTLFRPPVDPPKLEPLNEDDIFGDIDISATMNPAKEVQVVRTLDYTPSRLPLGLFTTLFTYAEPGVRPYFIVGLPGIIGAFSGMNDLGFTVTMSSIYTYGQFNYPISETGIPNLFFLRSLLRTCTSTFGGQAFFAGVKLAYPMNIVLASPTSMPLCLEIVPPQEGYLRCIECAKASSNSYTIEFFDHREKKHFSIVKALLDG